MKGVPVQGEYQRIEDYIQNNSSAEGEKPWMHIIHEGGEIPLRPPKTVCEPHQWFSYLGDRLSLGRAYLARIPQAQILARESTAAIITPDNKLLVDADYIQSLPSCRRAAQVAEHMTPGNIDAAVLMMAGRHAKNYWHWMFNLLPLFELLKTAQIPLARFEALALQLVGKPFEAEILEALGEPLPPILNLYTRPYVTLGDCIIATNPTDERSPDPWRLNFVRSLFLPGGYPARRDRRIYLSRKGAARNFSNEVDVIQEVQRHGFELYELAGLSIRQQAKLFSEAEVILSAHGSALANTVFCTPGSTVIEVISPNLAVDYFRPICSALDVDYWYLMGEGEPAANPQESLMHADFPVSIDLLRKTLSAAGFSPR